MGGLPRAERSRVGDGTRLPHPASGESELSLADREVDEKQEEALAGGETPTARQGVGGYELSATVYPDTRLGRVSIAIFVSSSTGSRARDCEASLLGWLFD